MKRKFVANISFLIFVNLLVKPFWIFGIDRSVQNLLGAETYGLYFSLFNFSILFNIILDFGINNYNNRSVAQDGNFLKDYLPNILLLKIGLAIIYLAVTGICAFFFNFSAYQLQLLAFLALNQVLLSFLLYLRTNISGMHLFRMDSMLSVSDKLLMILICGYLLWSDWSKDFKIEWFIYAQTVSLLISAGIAMVIVLYKAGKFSFSWGKGRVIEVIRNTYPYALLGLLMSIYYRIDGVMIERMLPEDGAYEAGVYAASYRLLDAFNMLGFLFATILLPMFARMLKENHDIKDLLGFSFKALFSFATFIAVICFFYRQEIMHLLYRNAGNYWWQIFGVLIFAYLGICVVYIYGTLLTANGSLKSLNIIAVSGVVMNIVLNFILIQYYKAMGATIATIITQTAVALAHIAVANKVFRLKINFRQAGVFMVFSAGMILAIVLLKSLAVDWKLSFFLGAAASLMLAMVLKLFDVKKALVLLRSK